MDLKLHRCAESFSEATMPWMLKHETLHCKIFSALGHLKSDPSLIEGATLAEIHNGTRCMGVALRTKPGATLFLGPMEPSAISALSAGLSDYHSTLSRLQGPQYEVDQFAEEWSALTSTSMNIELDQGCYECVQVTLPRPADGHMIRARLNHLEPSSQLLERFIGEIEGTSRDMSAEVAAKTQHFIESGRAYLWVSTSGEYVSSTVQVRESPNGASLSLVYTPPSYRGCGYASNLVAHVTQRLLDEGKTLVNLFTDRSNRQSNAIYQRIGYLKTSDCRVYVVCP